LYKALHEIAVQNGTVPAAVTVPGVPAAEQLVNLTVETPDIPEPIVLASNETVS
jgi:hypothetical protein